MVPPREIARKASNFENFEMHETKVAKNSWNGAQIENKKKVESDKIIDKDNQKSLENSDNSLLNVVA